MKKENTVIKEVPFITSPLEGEDACKAGEGVIHTVSPSFVLRTFSPSRGEINQGSIARGFTLIELLVVVLIIGILAAVAVPQYQKAVNKSRASTALAMLKAIHNAQEVHHLETGEYASDLEELSIEIPVDVKAGGWTGYDANHPNKYMFSCNDIGNNCNASAASNHLPSFEYHYNGKLYCMYDVKKPVMVEQICQSFGGVYSHTYTKADYNIEVKYYRI